MHEIKDFKKSILHEIKDFGHRILHEIKNFTNVSQSYIIRQNSHFIYAIVCPHMGELL